MMTKKRFFMALAAAVVLSIASFSASAETAYLIPEFALWYQTDDAGKKDTVSVPNLEFRADVTEYKVTLPYETDSLVLKLAWKKLNLSTGNLEYAAELPNDSIVPEIKVVDDVTGKQYGDHRKDVYYHWAYWVPYPNDVKEFTGHVEVKFPVGFPGYSGKTLTYKVTITRDDIRSTTTLRYLEVWRFDAKDAQRKDTIITRFDKLDDSFAQLSSADGPFTVTAKAVTDTFQIRLVTSKGKVDSVSYKTLGVNNGKDTIAYITSGTSDVYETVDSLGVGDVIDITVWAENRKNYETYRVILNAAPGKAAPDGKPLREGGFVSAVWLEDKVDGRDTIFALSPNFTGWIKKTGESPYTAAVPDPSSSNLKVKYKSNEAMPEDSILSVFKVVDQEDATKFSFQVKLVHKTSGEAANQDSAFTINLQSSENRLADLVIRSDSASGATLILEPAFHPDTTYYNITTLLPYDVAVLHLFAAARDAGAKVSYVAGTFNAPSLENDTVKSLVPINDNPKSGLSAGWQVTVKSVSGDLKTYTVRFRKAFNLNVKEITVTYDGKPLKVEGEPEEVDYVKKFEYDVLVDTSIPLSKYEEIKVTFTPAFAIKDKFPVGIVATEFLEKEAGKWTKVLRLTPDAGAGREYRVNLLTPSADADLKYLYVEPGFSHLLEPAFSPSVTEYQLRLPAGTTDLSFVAVAHRDARGIEGNGEQSFEAPSTTYTITVTAQNGTKKEYTVHAHEDGSGLKAISIFTSAVAKDGVLTLTTPQRETVYVHTADGRVVSVFDKPAGAISVPLSIAKGTVVLRGTSGWVAKTLVR